MFIDKEYIIEKRLSAERRLIMNFMGQKIDQIKEENLSLAVRNDSMAIQISGLVNSNNFLRADNDYLKKQASKRRNRNVIFAGGGIVFGIITGIMLTR